MFLLMVANFSFEADVKILLILPSVSTLSMLENFVHDHYCDL